MLIESIKSNSAKDETELPNYVTHLQQIPCLPLTALFNQVSLWIKWGSWICKKISEYDFPSKFKEKRMCHREKMSVYENAAGHLNKC
jgi:hypothetical protein